MLIHHTHYPMPTSLAANIRQLFRLVLRPVCEACDGPGSSCADCCGAGYLKGPDFTAMLVLADALEEGGAYGLARAWRWAGENEKWPDKYGWGREADARYQEATWGLPQKLYSKCCDLIRDEGFVCGMKHRAFLRLALALEATKPEPVEAVERGG